MIAVLVKKTSSCNVLTVSQMLHKYYNCYVLNLSLFIYLVDKRLLDEISQYYVLLINNNVISDVFVITRD